MKSLVHNTWHLWSRIAEPQSYPEFESSNIYQLFSSCRLYISHTMSLTQKRSGESDRDCNRKQQAIIIETQVVVVVVVVTLHADGRRQCTHHSGTHQRWGWGGTMGVAHVRRFTIMITFCNSPILCSMEY